MVSEVSTSGQELIGFVGCNSKSECALRKHIRQDRKVSCLLFCPTPSPLICEFIANDIAPDPGLNPIIIISPGPVGIPHSFQRGFWMLNFLKALFPDLRQPLAHWFGLRRRHR